MTVFHALVLGLLQGLTEFLPVSSSAHLALAPWIFGWPQPGLSFDVALHIGTLAAVLSYFRHEWLRLLRAAWEVVKTRRVTTAEQRRVIYLAVATVPAGVIGFALNDHAESTFRDPVLIAAMLMGMGIVLWLIDRGAQATRELGELRCTDALLIGLAQVFALLPGVSRSGATIAAGRGRCLDREAAATFSFLMSMPIIAAAAVFKVPEALRDASSSMPLITGILAAAVSGWLAIAVLLRYVTRHGYGLFAVYRLVVGALVLAAVVARA